MQCVWEKREMRTKFQLENLQGKDRLEFLCVITEWKYECGDVALG